MHIVTVSIYLFLSLFLDHLQTLILSIYYMNSVFCYFKILQTIGCESLKSAPMIVKEEHIDKSNLNITISLHVIVAKMFWLVNWF